MSEYNILFMKEIIANYTGDFYDTSYEPLLRLQYELPREIFANLFSKEITILQDMERLICEFLGKDLHFYVFFPKSSLNDLWNDNNFWFVINKNKITGIVFNSKDIIKDDLWPKIKEKLKKLNHLKKVLIRLPEENGFKTFRVRNLPKFYKIQLNFKNRK